MARQAEQQDDDMEQASEDEDLAQMIDLIDEDVQGSVAEKARQVLRVGSSLANRSMRNVDRRGNPVSNTISTLFYHMLN